MVVPTEYRRRIRAWALYDWANSAFATTVLAAVLPIYFSRVAGSTLPSPAIATALYALALSVSLAFIAVLSPLLGALSDVRRSKKRMLALFVAFGATATALLALVGEGDWALAVVLFVIARIGFGGANVFYDALLPHVATEGDRDRVSAQGYALGYVGGGLLLALNILMILVLGDDLGPRLSFASVGVWWAVFSIPLLRVVPEPATVVAPAARSPWRASFSRLRQTLGHIRRYRQLFLFLVAFLVYNDGIGTIIGVAAIYGAELGFGTIELLAALLLVQFVGIPFTLILGRVPGGGSRRAVPFVVATALLLPAIGVVAGRTLDEASVGRSPAPLAAPPAGVGEGEVIVGDAALDLQGPGRIIPRDQLGRGAESAYLEMTGPGRLTLTYAGDAVEIRYALQPQDLPGGGRFAVFLDGEPVEDPDEPDEPLVVDTDHDVVRYEETVLVEADEPGTHSLHVVSDVTGGVLIGGVDVLPLQRRSNIVVVFGLLAAATLAAVLIAYTIGARLRLRLDTKGTIMLTLGVYAVVAIWGFFLDAVIEFWFLAWMVAMVQGGSQALSRSLYSDLSPARRSGEFFGFFSIMAKLSAVAGPLLFAAAAAAFDSSRPAVLGIIVFFVVGGALLARVDVDEGRRVARAAERGSP